MFTEDDVIAFLSAQGVKIPGFPNMLDDDDPDRAYAVSVSGGLGLMMEDQEDRPAFSIIFRGPSAFDVQNASTIVSNDANEIDAVWINHTPMFQLGPVQVKGKGRLTGPPSFVTVDDRRRTVRAATYWCRIVRTPGPTF